MNEVSMNIIKVLFSTHVLVNVSGKVNWGLILMRLSLFKMPVLGLAVDLAIASCLTNWYSLSAKND